MPTENLSSDDAHHEEQIDVLGVPYGYGLADTFGHRNWTEGRSIIRRWAAEGAASYLGWVVSYKSAVACAKAPNKTTGVGIRDPS